MNTMIRFSRKIVIALTMVGALAASDMLMASRCQSCAQKLAIKQSIKDALAASLAAANAGKKDTCLNKCNCGKPKPAPHKPSAKDHERCSCSKPKPKPAPYKPSGRSAKATNNIAKDDQPCCNACALSDEDCSNINCFYSTKNRAEREANANEDSAAFPVFYEGCNDLDDRLCVIGQQLEDIALNNDACCRVVHRINDHVKSQGRDAKKCCSRLKHKIDDVEELVLSQIDESAICCSVIDNIQTLVISQIDEAATCCSVIDTIQTLVVSQIDESALCCSVIDAGIGGLDGSALDIPLQFSITDFANTTEADIITWLKSIYVLVANTYYCTCA